ncbi:MAG: hypothetical protein K2P52_02530 [Campylobacterales bacterium]|nr:hypothetical protein [Campylobacterales bacterium]
MSYIDQKYIGMIGFTLRNFKRKSNSLYNFSCPYCEDSKTDKYKARGYLYIGPSNNWLYKCHNCGIGKSFNNFLREQNPIVYKEYRFEAFSNKSTNEVTSENIEDLFNNLSDKNDLDHLLLRCDHLTNGHPAIEYLKGRSILSGHENFYYSNNLNVLKQLFTGYDNVDFKEDKRIIFPIKNISGTIIGVISRSLDPKSKLRYINLRRGNEPLIYNLENIDFSAKKYVVEGPIDSLFIKNCAAAIGSDLFKCTEVFDNNTVYIFDNQPKNL